MRTVTWYFHAFLLLMDISVILPIVNNAGMKLFHIDVFVYFLWTYFTGKFAFARIIYQIKYQHNCVPV